MPRELPDWVITRRQVIGVRIREARLAASLTQLQLADMIGRDHRMVHFWEHGTRDPRLSDLLLIARACGVPLSDLVGE